MLKKPGDIILLQICTINQDNVMYFFLEFFIILGHFSPTDPPNNPKNQNFEKMEKTPGDIIILHLCTTNDNHMMHHSSDIECNRQNFLSFWTIFCSFNPLTT